MNLTNRTRRGEKAASDTAPLWRAYKQGNCQQARAQLIERYRPLVEATRRRTVPHPPLRVLADDLRGEGLLALVKAVDRFDPDRGVKFQSFAISLIRGAMLQHLRREDWVPRSVRDQQKLCDVMPVLELVSLEDPLPDRPGKPALRIPDPAPPLDERVAAELEAGVVKALVRCLPRRERHVVLSRYWEEREYGDIALDLDLSKARIIQLHQLALSLMRAQLAHREEFHATR